MVAHMLFTKLMDALFSSYTNLGTKMPKNDATITPKKTTQLLKSNFYWHIIGTVWLIIHLIFMILYG